MQTQFKHVSWERLVSGPGIYTIFRFLNEVKRKEIPSILAKEIRKDEPAAVISKRASDYSICTETMELLFNYLAREAGNLALKLKATVGIFIGGGILGKNLHLLNRAAFAEHFSGKGRMKGLLASVRVVVILNDKTAMLGAAQYAIRTGNREVT